MMRLPPFRYLAPVTIAEAVQILADHGPDATVVAGGTDLYPNMKRLQVEPKVLVGLRQIKELRGLSGDEKTGITIRPNMTLTQVASDPRIVFSYPAIARAAGQVSTVHLRNMGTLGGNLCLDTRCNYINQNYEWRKAIDFCKKKDGDICWVATASPRCWAVSSSDTAPVMVALGASFRLASAKGERTVAAHDFYNDDGIRWLNKQPDEVLTEVILPPAEGLQTTYWKLRRRGSFDFPVLGVAVALERDNGTVRSGKIVLGAVSSAPVVAEEASSMLAGQKLTPELIEEVAEKAWRPARPLDNTDFNYAWRKRMAKVYVKRALRELAGLPIRDEELPVVD